jgi:hypothetical protein
MVVQPSFINPPQIPMAEIHLKVSCLPPEKEMKKGSLMK